ncbi:MAG: hypothetical protein ACRD2I_04365, partial [Vicinamibacterales bacterium]
VEAWLDNQGDGWRYVIDLLDRSVGDGAALARLANELYVLGTTTAGFHAALAAGDGGEAFAPEPVARADIERWRAAFRDQGDATFALVEQHHRRWTGDRATAATEFLALRPAFERRIVALDGWAHGGFQKIRVHGDYHLGQTLKTSSGFAIIDLEGEPSKPLEARREKRCALKDVAGMIRSFDYAVQSTKTLTWPERTIATLSDAFLEGYRRRARAAPFVPADPEALTAWVAFFELEKALYEIEYEANSRPTWVHIPLRGAVRILRH